MTLEQLAGRVGEIADRHEFLGKVGAATLGGLIGVLGVPSTSSASGTCCVLCWQHNPNCPNLQQVFSVWCWSCCSSANIHHHCCEGYGAGESCTGSCNGVICSYYLHMGTPCHGPHNFCA